MNIYFDTEFTGLHKDTTLVSLGMVADNGSRFYAEFTDYDKTQADDWLLNNVLVFTIMHGWQFFKDEIMQDPAITYVIGTKKEVVQKLKRWLSQFDEVDLFSDCCHYDMVLLIDLFGSAFDLPENVVPVCHDINQDIQKMFGLTQKEAFDMSREDILSRHGISVKGQKHNSLYDAEVIRQIYYGYHER